MATEYDLRLTGYVGGEDFDSRYVSYVLNEKKDEPVKVLIDSLGGSVATALSIANAFKEHGNVEVHFVGMNASAATIASLGAKRITIDRHAMYLAHKCSIEFFEWGQLNADQLEEVRRNCEQAVSDLNKIDSNVAAMYAEKCDKSEAELLDLMKVGGWLTAKEAKEWGFVDEVTDNAGDEKPELTKSQVRAMVAAGIPLPPGKQGAIKRIVLAIARMLDSDMEVAPLQDEAEATAEPQPETYRLEALSAAVGDEVTSVNSEVTLTLEQALALENLIAQQAAQSAAEDREAEAETPADESNSVVVATAGNSEGAAGYAETWNNARQLYDMLP